MSDSSSLIESLLYQSESTAFDLKKEQYPFSGATEGQKSELLKDILAFANSWRQGDAYILIGVEAVVGGRHIPSGIEEHFDDAQLQQFVNSKTNRKVELSYEVHLFEGKKIGIIRILKQERPTYAIKKYGKVEKEVVYYRLGSSTAIAKPEDIARMGRDSEQSILVPMMNLQFADHDARQELGTLIKLFSVAYEKPIKSLPDARKRQENSIGRIGTFTSLTSEALEGRINADYWREKEEYIRLTNLMKPVTFVIRNQSSTIAERVRVEIVGSLSNGINITSNLPAEPAYYQFAALTRNIRPFRQKEEQTVVKHYGDRWTLTVNFGNVQPKSCVWSDEPFYIGSTQRDQLEMEAVIYADNLPEPQKVILTIDFETEKRSPLTVNVLEMMPPFEK